MKLRRLVSVLEKHATSMFKLKVLGFTLRLKIRLGVTSQSHARDISFTSHGKN